MTIPPETLRELERLRARVEELEWELDCMKSTVETEITRLMDFYDLTAGEARMIRVMGHAGGAPLTRAVLAEAIGNEIEDLRTVDSHIKRTRRKVGHCLPIDTIYGIGYRVLPETAKTVRDVMAGKLLPDKHRTHMLCRDSGMLGEPHQTAPQSREINAA